MRLLKCQVFEGQLDFDSPRNGFANSYVAPSLKNTITVLQNEESA